MKHRFLLAMLLVCACLVLTVSAAEERFTPGTAAVYFVDNANGNNENAGTSADAPLKTLAKANAYLREVGGGTIVISGEVAITDSYAPSAIGGAVVYTSLYDGVDYAKTAGAKMVIGAVMAFSNDTYFEHIHLSMTASGRAFSGRCNNFGFGYGVTVTNDSGIAAEEFVYPVIIGGWNGIKTGESDSFSQDYTVHVYSGTWCKVYGGNRRTSTAHSIPNFTGNTAVIIRGGSFSDAASVLGTGMEVHTGRAYLEISGGEFAGKVIAISKLWSLDETTYLTDADYTADVLVRISGGTFHNDFQLAESAISTTATTYPPYGDATVVVTGGTFESGFFGYGVVGSVLLKYDPKVLSTDIIKGFPLKTTDTDMADAATETASFVNPIGENPDPYVYEKDGVYYYCYSSSGIRVAMHGNIPFGELTTQRRLVFTASMTDIANAKYEYWAPEIHYFDAATVGEENAGWYIYFAADDGDNVNHRMYVLRATDRENPLSDYEMLGQITDSTNKWAIDGTVLTLNGKLYFVWSGWEGDTNVAQNIYIAPMSNPWTISGERVLLSAPTYDWETQGTPNVNEGPQILQNDGTTHIIYSASGSWSQYYCYGALTLIGSDPLSASSWYKSTTPLLQSGNGVYGTGHGSFTKDINGNWWMYYHANSSLEVPEDSSWWAERQTYAKPFSFVTKTISGKTVSYPNFGTPAAYGSTQSLTVRTTDYHAADDHHYSPYMTYVTGNIREVTRRCYICGAYDVGSVDFTETLAFSLTSTTDSVGISWEKYAGTTGYKIYRRLPDGEKYEYLADVDKNATSYTDSGLAGGTYYRYLFNIYYTDLTGKSHYKATGGKAVYTIPDAPSITLLQNDDGSIAVSVTETVTCAGYKYYRLTEDGAWELLATTAETSVVDTDVVPGETYTYRVSAYNGANADGAFSAQVQITAVYEKPPYAETAEGELYAEIAARADGGEFTMLTRIRADQDLSVLLPYASAEELPAGEYVYCVTGGFITPVSLQYASEGVYVTQPSAESDAVVFSAVPLVRYGDATGDGQLSLLDCLRILKRSVSDAVTIDLAAADISGNLTVDIADALLLLKNLL